MNDRTPLRNLGDRTAIFAQDVRAWARRFSADSLQKSDIEQVIRSSGSVAANYVEANEALGKKNCGMHLKICRKEAKESKLWLQFLRVICPELLEVERQRLQQEAHEFVCIFHSIIQKHYS